MIQDEQLLIIHVFAALLIDELPASKVVNTKNAIFIILEQNQQYFRLHF